MAIMEKEIDVNKSSAELFYQQCMGSYSGHMSAIPNNPTINSICRCHGADDRRSFAKFLRKIADKLEDQKF